MSETDTKPTAETLVVRAVSRLKEARDPGFHRLKRGTSLLDAMLEPVFAQTVQRLRAYQYFVPHENIACALLLQPLVVGGSAGLGRALANESHKYSPLRFSQLIAADTPDELFTHLQRALRFVDGKVSPFDIARIALGWTENGADRTRRRLIAQYHVLPDEQLHAS